MQKYVVVHLASNQNRDKILLVEKNRPENQKGKYNYLGGKVEENESSEEAAVREIKEESGIDLISLVEVGQIKGCDFLVYCFYAEVDEAIEISPRIGETEEVSWHNLFEVVLNPKLMDNLKILIPLLRCGVAGWKLNHVTDKDWLVMFTQKTEK